MTPFCSEESLQKCDPQNSNFPLYIKRDSKQGRRGSICFLFWFVFVFDFLSSRSRCSSERPSTFLTSLNGDLQTCRHLFFFLLFFLHVNNFFYWGCQPRLTKESLRVWRAPTPACHSTTPSLRSDHLRGPTLADTGGRGGGVRGGGGRWSRKRGSDSADV